MLLTGEPIDAERAAAVGLVNRVVEEGAALDAAQRRLARGEDGTEKPLSVGNATLRRIAQDRPRDLSRYLDAPRLDRFGPAFAVEIAEPG